jgi:hypothetical protein
MFHRMSTINAVAGNITSKDMANCAITAGIKPITITTIGRKSSSPSPVFLYRRYENTTKASRASGNSRNGKNGRKYRIMNKPKEQSGPQNLDCSYLIYGRSASKTIQTDI